MDAVVQALVTYVILLVLFRLTGKRSLSQATTFDFVLLLIIGEATQQVLVGTDSSITMAAIVIATLIAADRFADYLGYRFRFMDRLLESVPVMLVDDGKMQHGQMRKAHITVDDIFGEARLSHGLESMADVKYAILEQSGAISIVPRARART